MMRNSTSNLSIFIYLNHFVPNEDVKNEMKRNGSPTSGAKNDEECVSRPCGLYSCPSSETRKLFMKRSGIATSRAEEHEVNDSSLKKEKDDREYLCRARRCVFARARCRSIESIASRSRRVSRGTTKVFAPSTLENK